VTPALHTPVSNCPAGRGGNAKGVAPSGFQTIPSGVRQPPPAIQVVTLQALWSCILQAVHGCLAAIGDLDRPAQVFVVFQTGPRRRVWASVRQVHPYLVTYLMSVRYLYRKDAVDAGSGWPQPKVKS
jgi:hypothetical protein